MNNKYNIFHSDNVTFSGNLDNDNDDNEHDILIRYEVDDSGKSNITAQWTQNVIKPMQNLFFREAVYSNVIKNQWKISQYKQEYDQFLNGAYTQDEFLEVANKYARPYLKVSSEQLTSAAAIILDVLEEEIDTGELAQILNVDPYELELALSSTDLVTKIIEEE